MTRRAITRRQAVDAILHRVLLQFGTYLKCAISGEDLKPGDPRFQLDHIHCVELGGTNAYDNLRPVLKIPHQKKSKADMRMIKKTRPGHAGKFVVVRPDATPAGAVVAVTSGATAGETAKPKRPWPSREIPSRPFGKRKERA